ncbi:MAG: hypothetical protein V4619_16080, partial [Bacteroidota bacterium]
MLRKRGFGKFYNNLSKSKSPLSAEGEERGQDERSNVRVSALLKRHDRATLSCCAKEGLESFINNLSKSKKALFPPKAKREGRTSEA